FSPLPPNGSGVTNNVGVNGYTFANSLVPNTYYPYLGSSGPALTNAANIIGLMSTPEFTDANGNPVPSIFYNDEIVYSNHIVVYAYSVSGLAVEKPPQDNAILQQDSFGYRIFCVNAPVGVNTNDYIQGTVSPIEHELANNLHEL